MIRAWLPRRISIGILALGVCTAAAGVAAAQGAGSDARAVTVIGNDGNARRCGQGVNAGETTDRIIEECTRALNSRRLERVVRIQVLVNRGVTHLRRGENEFALADFDTVIDLDRRHAEAHLNRGAALLQMQQYGPSIASITEALGLGVLEPHKAYFNRGIAREALGDLRGAFEDYNTALQIEPDWGPANAELARFARGRRDRLATVLEEPSPQ